jgi:hypothetical protein
MDSAQDTLAGGFPHSEIFGSKLVRSSPKLFAAYHVLHRLSAPRHPPNALKALDHSHCRYPSAPSRATISTGEKTSFFEICPIAGGLRLRVRATDPLRASDKPSLHDVRQHASTGRPVSRNSSWRTTAKPNGSGGRSPSAPNDSGCLHHEPSEVVEPDGIEPTTSCLQSRRSPN